MKPYTEQPLTVALADFLCDATDSIINPDDFEERSQVALQKMSSIAQKYLNVLEQMLEQYDQIRALLNRIGDRAENECADVLQTA